MPSTGHLGNRRKMRALQIAALALTGIAPSRAALQSKDAGGHQDEPCRVIYNFARTFAETKPAAPVPLPLRGNFSCALPGSLGVDFIVATIPNPVETHLALWFDRTVEALQNAAGSLGYRFHEAWVPWDPGFVRDEPDIAKREHQEEERSKRNKEPAVLLFRAPDRVPNRDKRPLVVLLVPETPTGGIEPDAFQDAVTIVSSTTTSQELPELLLLGPSFSGSFASLARIERTLAQKPGMRPLWTVSGTAASADAWRVAFERDRYHTTVHDTGGLWQMLERHLGEWVGRPRIAILSESETGYGWENVSGGASGRHALRAPLVVRYPREISRLRNAYEEAELKSVVGAQPQATFRNLLSFRFYDNAASSDTSPVLAKNQTPLSQDSVLEEISQTLARDQINFAAILGTDIFDSLFIARYLRDSSPNVRLVTFDSDLLFVRGAQDFPFEGTLAVTTYPLIASNQGWTNLHQMGVDGRPKPERMLFSSRGAEGAYNAMRSLILHAHPLAGAELAEYSSPAGCRAEERESTACRQPPIWLTVVSRTGYWPLAVGDPSPAGSDATRLLPWPSGNHAGIRSPPLPRLWRMLFGLIVASIVWHFLSAVIALRRRYTQGFVSPRGARCEKPGFIAWSRDYTREDGWPARLCYHSLCSFALVTLYASYISPLFPLSLRAHPSAFGAYFPVAEGLLLVFILFTAAAFFLTPGFKALLREKRPDRWHFAILGIALLIALAFCWFVYRLNYTDRPHLEGFFFAYRSIHLGSGVSPLIPLLFLLLSYFVWAKVHLRRVGMVYDSKPWLPDLGVPKRLVLDEYRDDVDRLVRDPLPWHWRTLGAWTLGMLIWYYLVSPLQTFEYAPYNTAIMLSLALLYALLFLTWTRLLLIWRKFRLFLEALERHPIRFAFSSFPKQESWSPILQSTMAEKDSAAYFRVRDALRLLRHNAAPELRDAIEVFDLELTNALELNIVGARFFPKQATALVQAIKTVDDLILRALTDEHWQAGHSETQAEQPPSETSPWTIAEEVIALQYVTYIRYTLRQMKNLLLFVSIGFILGLVSLHSYPFQAPQTITTFVTLMFLIFATGVTIVLMQADRNAILSRITNTAPGRLGSGFYLHAAAYLGLPLVTVLGSQIPSWGRFLFSWMQPMLAALK